jgi:HD-GYP domain-containing protein (c-di-GMP phosphodiesterase class II)/CHASE2 domain-containing sensor protein
MIRFKWQWWLVLALVSSLAWGSLGFFRPLQFEKLERQVFDWHLSKKDFPEPPVDIVLVLGREETLSRFGKWPWPRRYHAKLLGRLGGARANLFDILFPERSTPEDDQALVEVVRLLGNVIFPSHLAPGVSGSGPQVITPFPELLEASAATGFTNVEVDIDALMRFAMPVRRIGDLLVPTFALAALPLVSGETLKLQEKGSGALVLNLGSKALPIDSGGRLWIHFRKKPYETYEYYDVLSGKISPEVFYDKIVVVGVAASGVEDFYSVPSSNGNRVITGAQVNAEILHTLLSGLVPKRTSLLFDGLTAFILAFLGALVGMRVRPMGALTAIATLCLLFGGFTHYLFIHALRWHALVIPTSGLVSNFFIFLFVRFKFIHKDWTMKTVSILSIYDLAQRPRNNFGSFEEYIESVWPAVERNTDVKLLSSGTNLPDALGEKAIAFKTDAQSPGSDIMLVEDAKDTLRYKMLIPLAGQNAHDGTGYALLGSKRRISKELLQALAAMVISSSWFFNLLAETQERKKLLLDTIYAIFTAVDLRDPITGGHSTRVSETAIDILKRLDLDPQTVEDIHLGALIHDIGKIGIPDSVLTKKGKLTKDEYELIKDHPDLGNRIMSSVRLPENTLKALCEHHERYNGKGYPSGKKMNQISLAGRIVAVADVFDALASDRPYRKGMSLRQVCDFLHERVGTDFDPDIVKLLLEMKAPPDWCPHQDGRKGGARSIYKTVSDQKK